MIRDSGIVVLYFMFCLAREQVCYLAYVVGLWELTDYGCSGFCLCFYLRGHELLSMMMTVLLRIGSGEKGVVMMCVYTCVNRAGGYLFQVERDAISVLFFSNTFPCCFL